MPDPAYKKKAELPAQPTITVADVAQQQ
jgi:hypothetical protein